MNGGREMTIDVIIPARNEADTIGGVIDAFYAVKDIGRIIVAVNPPTDIDTALRAELAGAVVVRAKEGKGEAIHQALELVTTRSICLCDGDLTGLTPAHVRQFALDRSQLTIGVPDRPLRSPVPWHVSKRVHAMMSGQRCLPADIVRAVPLHRYTVEAFLNREAERQGLPVHLKRLRGVTGKIRNNEVRMAELREDREWLRKNW